MTLLQAFILGIVQGLTEFLPISSSGHLVIGQHLFGLRHADLAFDVSVHVGTLGAVVIYFRRDIGTLLRSLLRWRSSAPQASKSADRPDIDARLAVLIFWGSIPTALIGLVLKRYEATLFASPLIAGAMLIVTGCILYLTRRPQISAQNDPGSMRPMGAITLRDSLLMGIVQGLAVMPGISRSGTTIAAGLFTGLAPQAAARFSFLLSIPAVAGAALLVLTDALAQGQVKPAPCLVGGLTALVVGYAALAILVYLIGRGKLFTFAPYCWMAGIAAIAVGW
ncbi:MAG: undecaprenyl-diphosphate phosphatase [Desulfobacterales bacterium]|nr:undecaprenyl-diphosphate phosphatase [Desulfobacterales bacterium]MDJ0886596.1 undecaprenyl-diphosphate phosphatase [Desulfobacterales bacterium]